jgi:predicted ester cyclase
MNLDHNKALVCRVIEEVWNKGDLSVIPEVYAPDFVSHQHSHPDVGDVRGVAALAAFPDFYDTIDDQVAEGDKVVTRVTSAGTQRGVLMGLQPTNKRASWMAIAIDRIEGEGSWKSGSAGTSSG